MARDFNGTTGYLKRAAGVLSTVDNNFTMAAWVMLDANQAGRIMHNGHSVSSGTGAGIRYSASAGKFKIDIAYVAEVVGTSSPNTSGTTWYHVVGLRRSGTWELYVNGTSEATLAGNPPYTPATNFSIGVDLASDGTTTGEFWNGKIAEVGFWERALTAAEVLSLSTGLSPLFYPLLLKAYVPIFGNNSPELNLMDASTMTLSGTAPASSHPRIFYPSSKQMRRFTTATAAAGATWPGYQSPFGW